MEIQAEVFRNGVWMRSETGKDQENSETGQGQGKAGAQPGSGADTEIEATGDAIIIADALHAVAASFREVAAAIRNVTSTPEEKDDDEEGERYLDGSKR